MIGEKIFRAALVLLRTADAHGDGFALVMSHETFEDFADYLESRSTVSASRDYVGEIHWLRKPMLRGVPIIRTKDVEGVRLAIWSEAPVELTEPDDPSLIDKADRTVADLDFSERNSELSDRFLEDVKKYGEPST